MKASLRLESLIEVYRDRVIIPRQVAEMSDCGIKMFYTATVVNEEDPSDIFCEELRIDSQFTSLDSLIQEIKQGIDAAIARRDKFWEEEMPTPQNVFEALELALKNNK